MARTTHREARSDHPTAMGMQAGSPALIRWGAVFGGVIIGLSLLILLTALWMALAFGTGNAAIQESIAWYVGVSAIVAMFIGGLVSGWLSGVPGAGPGFFNGLTVWGLILIASLAVGAPGTIGMMGARFDALTFQQLQGELAAAPGDPFWATFVSLLVGAIVAGIGGLIGGMLTHPAVMGFATGGYREREEYTEERPREDFRRDEDTVPPHEHRDGRTIDLRRSEEEAYAGRERGGDGHRH